MKPVLIFRHIDCEGPGYLAEVLKAYHIPFKLVRIDKDEVPPPGIGDISGLVFMGGSMSVNDQLGWIPQELSLIQKAVSQDMPVLGHCLGGQLISKALGGEITANPVKEIGWLPVKPVSTPVTNEWLADSGPEITAFHWHGETFSIPEGASCILQSQNCPHQGFALGNTLALQCHIEMTADMVDEWSSRYQHELVTTTSTIQSRAEMMDNIEEKIKKSNALADGIYQRWCEPLLKA